MSDSNVITAQDLLLAVSESVSALAARCSDEHDRKELRMAARALGIAMRELGSPSTAIGSNGPAWTREGIRAGRHDHELVEGMRQALVDARARLSVDDPRRTTS